MIEPQYTAAPPRKGPPRWFPNFLRIVDEPLIPLLYVQVTLGAGVRTGLLEAVGAQGVPFPARASLVVVNVEGGALRYCDADSATSSYGELYAVGSVFARSVDPRMVTLCGVGAGSIANVSIYGRGQQWS